METFCAAALEEGGQATGHDAAGGGGGRGARGAGGGSGSTVLGCLQGSTHRAGFGADCLGAVKAATAVQLSDMRANPYIRALGLGLASPTILTLTLTLTLASRADSALYSACAAYAEARCPEQLAAASSEGAHDLPVRGVPTRRRMGVVFECVHDDLAQVRAGAWAKARARY